MKTRKGDYAVNPRGGKIKGTFLRVAQASSLNCRAGILPVFERCRQAACTTDQAGSLSYACQAGCLCYRAVVAPSGTGTNSFTTWASAAVMKRTFPSSPAAATADPSGWKATAKTPIGSGALASSFTSLV